MSDLTFLLPPKKGDWLSAHFDDKHSLDNVLRDLVKCKTRKETIMPKAQVTVRLDKERLAQAKKIDILVSGQRFENYSKLDCGLTVFRPLVAYSEEDVEGEMERFSYRIP
ncbi:hypothetical protein HYU21_01445 [Candidatus Woesearchaeota archaeon]|nr:hypothetical protein [Candidatus Woesearchaeota archaeon]